MKQFEVNGKRLSVCSTLTEANAVRNAEWDPNKKFTPLFFAVELGGEVGELLNYMKKLERERLGMKGSRAGLLDVEKELADVVICASLLANSLGIDLHQAVANKYNESSEKLGFAVRLAEEFTL